MANPTENLEGAALNEMWRELVTDSLLRPRAAARRILDLHAPPAQLFEAAVFVTCLAVILAYLAMLMSARGVDAMSTAMLATPLVGAVVELVVIMVLSVLACQVGRLLGGNGGFAGAFALVVWLNAMLVVIQTGQLVALAVFPPLAALLAIATIVWAFWAFANFVAELHGFQNPFMVLGGVVLTLVVLFFAVSMFFAFIGVTPPRGAS